MTAPAIAATANAADGDITDLFRRNGINRIPMGKVVGMFARIRAFSQTPDAMG